MLSTAPAEFAARYFLEGQLRRHGSRFASRKRKTDPRPDIEECRLALTSGCDKNVLIDWLERYQFTGVIPNVNAALARWLRGDWNAVLCDKLPSAREVLRMQVDGARPVTVVTDPARIDRPILSRANAFEFLLHDLEHVYQFFYDPQLHILQRRFFAAIERALGAGWFDTYLDDPVFAEQFDYLIGDMNTHPQHGLQFLRAQLVEFYLRKRSCARALQLSPMDKAEIDSLLQAVFTKESVAP